MTDYISDGAIKVIELIGVSEIGFEQAMQQAVSKAAETIQGITGVEVLKQSARVQDGVVCQYRVNVRIAFVVQ
ncbi:MAG: dodecin domain-containing protein [Candidatus Latescibacterota bacterium]|nr:MAG: dodecin domain-containing protein [Candidatus Latescibacterota bacterium]